VSNFHMGTGINWKKCPNGMFNTVLVFKRAH